MCVSVHLRDLCWHCEILHSYTLHILNIGSLVRGFVLALATSTEQLYVRPSWDWDG